MQGEFKKLGQFLRIGTFRAFASVSFFWRLGARVSPGDYFARGVWHYPGCRTDFHHHATRRAMSSDKKEQPSASCRYFQYLSINNHMRQSRSF